MNTNCSSRPKSSIHFSEPSNSFRKQFLFLKEAISLEVFCNWKEIHQNDNSACCLAPGLVDELFLFFWVFLLLHTFWILFYHDFYKNKRKENSKLFPWMKIPSNSYLFCPLICPLSSCSLRYTVRISISAEDTKLNSFNWIVLFSFFPHFQQVFPFPTFGFSA